MSESRLKGCYGKTKELLEIIAVIITIIWGVLTIAASIYIPNSVAFEVTKYLFLVMIPITVSMVVLRFSLRVVKSYFAFNCPNCSTPMFLPILPSMVIRSKIHEKDGYPDKFQGDPEYEVGCPSCQKTWHIVFRKNL